MSDDNLKNLESRLKDMVAALSLDHYGPLPAYPLQAITLILELCQEVIKLRQETAGERRNWGRMHT